MTDTLVEPCAVNILPSQFDLMKSSLNLASLTQKVVSQNMANVNTPGYRAVEAQIDGSAASITEVAGKSSEEQFEIVETDDPTIRNDNNNVDMDREVGKLNKAALLFRTYSQLLSTRLNQMRSAMQLR